MVDHVFPLLAQAEGQAFLGSDTLERCEFWNQESPDAAATVKDPQPAETGWDEPEMQPGMKLFSPSTLWSQQVLKLHLTNNLELMNVCSMSHMNKLAKEKNREGHLGKDVKPHIED